jgi:hypothetical protein
MSQPPPSSARPNHFAHASAPPSNPAPMQSNYPPAAQSHPYHAMPVPSGSIAANQVNPAMPAHFRMAQTGAITPAMDPPGTAVTSNNPRVSGRPAMSWAAALAACGVFVGVVAVAIAQRGDSLSDTQSAFVDPSHTAKAPAAQPVETQSTQAATNPLPPGLIGASPVQPVAPAPTAPAVAPVPGMADPNLGLQTPQPQAQTTPAATGGGTAFAAVPVPTAKAKPARPSGAAVARSTAKASSNNDDDDEATTTPKKSSAKASTKSSGKGEDEETRRALEELHKAQLEQSLGK